MAGLISRIGEVLNSELPTDSSLETRVMGVALPVDPFITGSTRFARKRGDFTSTVMADNTTSLASVGNINGQTLLTNEILDSIVPGSRLLIQDTELVTVDDFSTDVKKSQMTIRIHEKLRTQHPVGSKVLLYGHPIEVTGLQPGTLTETFNVILVDVTGAITGTVGLRYVVLSAPPVQIINVTDLSSNTALPYTTPTGNILGLPTAPLGSITVIFDIQQTLTVSSTVKIFPHDDLTFRFGAFEIQTAVLVNYVAPNYIYNLALLPNVRLPPPAPAGKSVQDGYGPVVGDTIYLRCWPVYESQILPLPVIPPQDTNFGPFCADWLSGTVTELTVYDEFMSLTQHDGALNPIITEEVQKNHVVMREPVRSDAVLFWDILRGSVNWNGQETLVKTDGVSADEPQVGEFQAHYKCVVPLNKDGQITSWRIRFTNPNTQAARVVITLEPTAPQVFDVPAQTTQYLKVLVSANPLVTRIFFAVIPVIPEVNNPTVLVPGGTLTDWCRIGGWSIDGSICQFVSYRLLAKVDSRFRWASTGLFCKPIFLNIEYLRSRLDLSANVNNGKIFF